MPRSKAQHVYELLPSGEGVSKQEAGLQKPVSCFRVLLKSAAIFLVIFFLVIASGLALTNSRTPSTRSGCDDVSNGYQCQPEISHYWGQYSPYFSIPSNISVDLPTGCEVTFAQILSRHGARDPTASKTVSYNHTIQHIHKHVKSFTGDYTFLQDYVYTLGADQLTTFGQQEMVNSGTKFYERYEHLTKQYSTFFRSSGQRRVVESAENFTQGYHRALLADRNATTPDTFPYPIVVISESAGSNNTLSHGLCTSFDSGPDSDIGNDAQAQWAAVFTPAITTRLNQDLAGADLSSLQTINMMDLCPFNTVALPGGAVSPFSRLFSVTEWQQYDYYQSLGKYYGFGNGNPLGPTQGVGFANELIARLTGNPVNDHTSVNHTLDDSNATFPLGTEHVLFADFSHDNDLTGIFSALGLYNATTPLSNTSLESTAQTAGYSASWTVPFAARAYIEKMTCRDSSSSSSNDDDEAQPEELVRILVNDRVIPLQNCGADALGRCTLSNFIASLSFAVNGGRWDEC